METLAVLRKHYNITQEELARKLDVSQSLLSKVENGTRLLTKDLRRRIKKTFGQEIEDAFVWFDPEEYFRNETHENWQKALVSFGVTEEMPPPRPVICSWCKKEHEGEPCRVEDLDLTKEPKRVLGDVELVFERSILDSRVSTTKWQDIFGKQPSGWGG